ncbi:flagellar hook-length control protein FliK [uncultured Microbacterium sp.]|uniref:flagellar hook-length control protein FliK n=1 Tax=uncultured Microbacterium sp. TaxID=191216 RepID=UPI0028DCFCA4|nr:flagellar hook-length control protein FliK [uncultured Microbacterium sp.]
MSAAPAPSTAAGSLMVGPTGARDGARASGAARDRAAAFDAALSTADRMLGADAVGARGVTGVDDDATTAAPCGDASEALASTPTAAVPALSGAREGEEREKASAVSTSSGGLASILVIPAEAPPAAVTDPAPVLTAGGTSVDESAAVDAETPAQGLSTSDLSVRESPAALSAAGSPPAGTSGADEPPAPASGSRSTSGDDQPIAAAPALSSSASRSASGATPVMTVARQDLRNVPLSAPALAAGGGGAAAVADASALRSSTAAADVEVPVEAAPAVSIRSELPVRVTGEVADTSFPSPASPASVAPVLPGPAPTASVTAPAAAAATANAPQPLAAQVAPAVLHLAQRPAGSHQLTMTIEPESLGPVTVRAHISADGEVQVHLLGATDAGREALRTLLGDLRRDLAAISPHASVALGAGADAGGGADRGPSGNTEQAPRDQARGREATHADTRAESGASPSARLEPTPARPTAGAGLDIFA